MTRILKSERGMALALAIVALVVVGALVAGALFSGFQEQRLSENERRALASLGVAEEGVYDIIRGWDTDGVRQLYAGRYPYPARAPAKDSVSIGPKTSASNTGSYSGVLTRLNGELFLVDVTGQDTTRLTGQRIGLLVRIKPLVLSTPAALTSGGANVVGGTASINGNDQIPPGWTGCGPIDSSRAAVRTQLNNTVTTNGRPTILGSPPVLNDPTLTDSSFSAYGDVTYPQLANHADVTLPAQTFANAIGPVVTNGTCDVSVATNWGSPTTPGGPCGTYFPIIHITGTDAVINGQEGQGVLLVDGSLSIHGGFQFFGVAIIKGSLRTAAGGGGTPAHFWGTVMVQDSVALSDTTNTIGGAANFTYSKCAIVKAINKAGTGTMLRSRGWTQLY